MKTPQDIATIIKSRKTRSAWDRAVQSYALELLEGIEPGQSITEPALLNGAEHWRAYSYGGCSLVYDCDIAERVCCPSALKRSRDGALPPNRSESWLDVQARAIRQASRRVLNAARD